MSVAFALNLFKMELIHAVKNWGLQELEILVLRQELKHVEYQH